MKEHKKSKASGTTLIALVVTIIVLLLLAGISIMMLSGNNGVLQRAGEAKEETEEKQIIEQARMDILSTQTLKLTDEITERELKSILSKYGVLSKEERTIDKKLTSKDGKYIIPVSKIYNGTVVLSQPTIEDKDDKYYYGNFIDYDVDIDGTTTDYDWKIFYTDETNIYIISEDYVRLDNNLMPAIIGRYNYKDAPYSLFWEYVGDIVNDGYIQNGKAGSVDIFGTTAPNKTVNFAKKYLVEWKKALGNNTNENSNARMTATLLDTDLWSYNSSTKKGFTNSAKIQELSSNSKDDFFSIGGPTLEMWVKSWNKKYGTNSNEDNKMQLYYNSNATGYFIGTSAKPESLSVNLSETTGYADSLYYPHTSQLNYCWGYWLASPSANGNGYSLYINYQGKLEGFHYSRLYSGVRPVVCLPADVTATWNETDEVWNIIKK